MQLWAMAQKDFIENKKPNNLTFQVLQKTGKNPMIQVNANNKIIDFKNLNVIIDDDSLSLYKTLNELKKENQPIIIQYRDSLSGNLLIDQKLFY